jgi:hypothetical protein
LALLFLYKLGLKVDTLCLKTRYKTTALTTGLNRARILLNKVLKERWWAHRERPIPLNSTNFPYVALLTDINSVEVFRPTEQFEEAKGY